MLDSLTDCRLCPRKCGIDRTSGQVGFCRAGAETEIFRYGPHHGEEPPISGTSGSGTVFFGRCTMNCLYCQNYVWSQDEQGRRYSSAELRSLFQSLHDEGCHNWNLVSPTPWLNAVSETIGVLRAEGTSLPVVYNSSGFERVETLQALEGLVNIYLPDLRYADNKTAAEASSAPGYVETARAAIKEMWRQVGSLTVDDDGIAVSGLICRILILPGHADEAAENLRWLAENIGEDVFISLMSQYTPAYKARQDPWSRVLTHNEYDSVVNVMEELGLSNGWVQGYAGPADDSLLGWKMESS